MTGRTLAATAVAVAGLIGTQSFAHRAVANAAYCLFICKEFSTEPARKPSCAKQPTGRRLRRAQFATRTAEWAPTRIPDECDAVTIGRTLRSQREEQVWMQRWS